MFIFAVAVQGAATRYRGGETGGVGGRRRFAGPGPLAPGLQNQRSGGLPFGRPPPLCARFARPPPPRGPPKPRPPLPEGRLDPTLAPLRTGPGGPSALRGGGRRGARSAPAGRGPKAPARPVWRPEAAKRRRPPRQRWVPTPPPRLYAAFFLLRNRSTARSMIKNSSIRAHTNKGVIP